MLKAFLFKERYNCDGTYDYSADSPPIVIDTDCNEFDFDVNIHIDKPRLLRRGEFVIRIVEVN